MEILRNGLIALGLIGFLVTYGLLLRRAFARDVLWGFFCLFFAPFGGWLHGFTDRHNGRRGILLNICCLLLIAATLLIFPQPRIEGYWTTEDHSLVLRFDRNGGIRNFDVGADARYSFRDLKLANLELTVRSSTRLEIDGLGDFSVAYYNPSKNLIDLYTSRADPARGLRPDLPNEQRRLLTVREPLDDQIQSIISTMEKREAVLVAVHTFFEQPARPPLGPSVVNRYASNVHAARTLDAAKLARQPFPQIVEILRLRAMHGAALRAGASPSELFQKDILDDNFRLRKLIGSEPFEVRLYPGETQAYIAFRRRTETGEFVYDQLTAERHLNGLWGLDVDWHLLFQLPTVRADGTPRSVDEALLHLRDTYGLAPSVAWLQPVN